MDNAPHLIVIRGPNLGHKYSLQGSEASIGRSTSNSVVLPFPEISRRHARMWQDKDAYYLEDLGSTNGTFVDNSRLYEPARIYDGDEIQIGDSLQLLFTNPRGVTRPVALVPVEDSKESQPAAKSSVPSPPAGAYPSSEIPTPRPPLAINPDEQAFDADLPDTGGQERSFVLWCGCTTLILISICFLALLFLDSYQQGRLLYCGSLSPLFQFFLGPVGFNPVCP